MHYYAIILLLNTLVFNLSCAEIFENYCDLKCSGDVNTIHIACKRKHKCELPVSECYGFRNFSLKDSHKKYILDLHNSLRNKIASGNTILNKTFSDINVLEWDEELAFISLCWVNYCGTSIDGCLDSYRGPVGSNEVYQMFVAGNDLNTMEVIKRYIISWFSEIYGFAQTSSNVFPDSETDDQNIIHFSQLAWAKTKFVGCARSVYDKYSTMFVCLYWPSGNVQGEMVFQYGSPCSKCEDNNICDKKYPALCSARTVVNQQTLQDITDKNSKDAHALNNINKVQDVVKNTKQFETGILRIGQPAYDADLDNKHQNAVSEIIDLSDVENNHFAALREPNKSNYWEQNPTLVKWLCVILLLKAALEI